MILLHEHAQVYLYLPPVDMRKPTHGLNALLSETLRVSPQSGDVYLFHNKSCDKVKAIYWDVNGFIMHYKLLERGRFKIPKTGDGEPIELSTDQLSWLFSGLDFMLMQQFSGNNHEHYY